MIHADRHLKDKLAAQNAWVSSVYRETSGFIHFSQRHILAAIDGEAGETAVRIGPCDADKPDGYYREMLSAFLHVNMMIPVAAEDWLSRLGAPST